MVVPKPDDPQVQEFAAARALLQQLIQQPDLKETFDPDERPHAKMIYTHGVTLWMLILQRLGRGQSLSDVVTHVVQHQTDLLPDNKRVREHTLAESTSAYSKARTRLPIGIVEKFSHQVCDYLGCSSEKIFQNRRVFILDGTTITLPPTPEMKKAFPPATNQYGESVWPVAMLMIAAELQSGCVLLPQVDPMYGPDNSSEAAQARQIVQRLPEQSIVMADSGFGIFSVAHHSMLAGHDFLFRLSLSRLKALRKKAKLIDHDKGYKSYHLTWTPSTKDLKTNPDLRDAASLEVLIHEVELEDGTTLALVTSLEIDAASSAKLYQSRYDVEFDIRDLKVTLDTENIRAKSVSMMLKELMTSVVAFNLVAQVRRQAAKLVRVEPRRLSFKGVWTTFREHLLNTRATSLSEWIEAYTRALISAGDRKHPNRKAPRTYPRVAHPRRPKTTKFQKSLRRKKPSPEEQPPPNQ